MQYNKIKFAVGLFTIMFFVVTSAYVYLLLAEKGLFDKRYNYNFNTQSAKDFSVGMPLKFSGFNIGVIDNISLKDDGTVSIVFSVNEENKKWIRMDTILKMSKPLIGSPYIEIQSNLDNALLKSDSTIKIIQSDDINDMISKMEPIIEKIIKIIDNIGTITKYLASEDSELIKTIKNLEKFSAKLANEDSLLTSVTGDKNSTQNLVNSINQLNLSMKDVKNITKNISDVSGSLDDKIIKPSSDAIKEVHKIMKDVTRKLEMIDSTVKSVGSYDKDLVDVKDQISLAIEKSNQIMDKVDAMLQDDEKSEVTLP